MVLEEDFRIDPVRNAIKGPKAPESKISNGVERGRYDNVILYRLICMLLPVLVPNRSRPQCSRQDRSY